MYHVVWVYVRLITINVLLLVKCVPVRRVYEVLGLICHTSANNLYMIVTSFEQIAVKLVYVDN